MTGIMYPGHKTIYDFHWPDVMTEKSAAFVSQKAAPITYVSLMS